VPAASKVATLSSSSCAEGNSPDPPQVGQESTWVPVVVMVIVLPPPHRQHLAMNRLWLEKTCSTAVALPHATYLRAAIISARFFQLSNASSCVLPDAP
jgi:hypothetical protein